MFVLHLLLMKLFCNENILSGLLTIHHCFIGAVVKNGREDLLHVVCFKGCFSVDASG